MHSKSSLPNLDYLDISVAWLASQRTTTHSWLCLLNEFVAHIRRGGARRAAYRYMCWSVHLNGDVVLSWFWALCTSWQILVSLSTRGNWPETTKDNGHVPWRHLNAAIVSFHKTATSNHTGYLTLQVFIPIAAFHSPGATISCHNLFVGWSVHLDVYMSCQHTQRHTGL